MHDSQNPILTVTEAAALIGAAPSTVRRKIDSGALPGFRLPGSKHRRILRRDIERLLPPATEPRPLASASEVEA